MPHRTFIAFILPSLIAMILFIVVPIGSVIVQAVYAQHEQVLVEVENCGPFGCTTELRVDAQATAELNENEPLGRFVGLQNFTNRSHLAFDQLGQILSSSNGLGDFLGQLYNLPFYKALAFTLTYTFIVTPIAIVLGFFIALAINAIPALLKGPVIFFSLLPMIVTPLVGSIILFWMINSQGVIGATLQAIFNDPDLSLRASPALTWVTLIVYGVWSTAPFSFVVFYAGLQTVPADTLESAMIDGANRWERVRFVIIPHLIPLATFVALVQLMDNFRVFEPIVGFSSEANATSLSWLVFNDLRGQGAQLFGSAAATSILTIIGVVILLTPVLIRTWRDFKHKA
ncbi:sugar ABC transporter permease [Pelagibacterium nitratireducens]|uniref:Sugar ABC transporter permease n=1 Tax=Pelagibacterium nitratireducens TaxID=1046114 RepID=A0ABZ2HW42_9HYPH